MCRDKDRVTDYTSEGKMDLSFESKELAKC